MNYQRIYAYRFQGIAMEKKLAAWGPIARYIQSLMPGAERILDPCAGHCEFINQVRAKEAWAVDREAEFLKSAKPGIRVVAENIFTASLPEKYFDGIFVSNFLEHLESMETVTQFLQKMSSALKPGGRLVVMGPNFKHCVQDYFDCSDHRLILTDRSAEELIDSEGFRIVASHSRFLPYSFRSRWPATASLVNAYLHFPLAWRWMGKQFLIVAEKPKALT